MSGVGASSALLTSSAGVSSSLQVVGGASGAGGNSLVAAVGISGVSSSLSASGSALTLAMAAATVGGPSMLGWRMRSRSIWYSKTGQSAADLLEAAKADAASGEEAAHKWHVLLRRFEELTRSYVVFIFTHCSRSI